MATSEQQHERAVSPDPRDGLRLIAEGVTAVAGFGVAAISALRDGEFEVMAVVGHPSAVASLTGARIPLASMMAELEQAEEWGQLRFVPHDRSSVLDDDWVWVPDFEPLDGADAWHPDDLLLALLHDDTGALRGLLSIDVPVSGRRPTPEQLEMLQRYAEQAGRAVVTTLEREELAERVRLARTARVLVREATTQSSTTDVLDTVEVLLRESFSCERVAIYLFADAAGEGASEPPGTTRSMARSAVRWSQQAWARQTVLRIPEDLPGSEPMPPEHTDYLARVGLTSVLLVPLGAGGEVVGCLSLGRAADHPGWSELEMDTALDIGHDLGRAILNVRALDVERRAVRRKDELVTTLVHELMTPITAIVGHVELLRDELSSEDPARRGVDAVGRGVQRLRVMAEDLMRLATTDDPARPLRRRGVDLGALAAEVVELVAGEAERGRVRLRVDQDGAAPALAAGDHHELDRVVFNLVNNAVKYSHPGGEVVVRVRRGHDEVILEVCDEGLGISEADQAGLFTEFFRSSNPEAASRPGTGLGLAIVHRTVARHGGSIEVDSALGRGSSFRVFLPAWSPGVGSPPTRDPGQA